LSTKEIDGLYYYNRVGYIFHGYMIIRIVALA